MKLSTIGEFGLIARITPRFTNNLPQNVLAGIGDDCAVIDNEDDTVLLLTTDMLVEGVHFLRHSTTPRDLGYKCLAVNLSDIAAMGGKPMGALLSMAIPDSCDLEWLDQWFDGFQLLLMEHDMTLLGGDTTRSPQHLVINACVTGLADKKNTKMRSGAKVGDIVCVTGTLGDSGGGFKLILDDRKDKDEAMAQLLHAHHRPRPQIEEGLFLGQHSTVHAMIDVSDGIASDLQRLSERSGVGFKIELLDLPLSPALLQTAKKYKWDPLPLATSAGEDYCLLATVDKKAFVEVAREFKERFHRPLHPIGEVVNAEKGIVFTQQGKVAEQPQKGFDHFAQK